MIKIFTLLLFLLAIVVVRTELTLERIDAIADLSALAKKYFSEEPNLRYGEPEAKMMNAFAWSVSDMWDENESALYVLTRLAKLIDERDANGELTVPARVIRSFAEKSEARKVYFTTFESSNAAFLMDSTESTEENAIEKLYLNGREAEADAKVVKMIQERWNDAEKAFWDIETAAKEGNFNLMSALIKIGSNHRALKFMAPEWKAGLIIKLLSLPRAEIQASTAKWLVTMETYREDQLKLVKTIEKALKKRSEMGQEKMSTLQQGSKNNLVQVFGEVETIMNGKKTEYSEDYFSGIASIDGNEVSKALYKKMKTTPKSPKNTKSLKSTGNAKSVKATRQDLPQEKAVEQPQQPEQPSVVSAQTAQEQDGKDRNFFEEQEKLEKELDQAIYENNSDPVYDDDGIYDDDEKERDRVAQLIVLIIIGAIITTAVGTYVYLRVRRARRNRTILVVTEALETVA